jgi:hypothetical protein
MVLTYKGLGKTTRLGNQMFYYSTLRSVGIRLNLPIKIPKREMDILKFNIQKDYLTSHDDVTILRTYTEPFYSYSGDVFNVKDNTNLVGHFKSYKYFDEIRDILLEEFTLDKNSQNYIDFYIRKLRERNKDTKFISIHVRHGDYINYPDVHPYAPLEYYKKCINFFENKFKCKFIIFSDDLDWCKKKITFSDNHFCDINNNVVEMLLMARCDHNIIANSTFSWWGAYLNKNEEKIVFYPDKWFGENSGTGDLLPKEWKIVKF